MNNRYLKYIAEQFLKQMAYVAGGSVLMFLWIWFIDDDNFADKIKEYPLILLMMLVIALIGYGMNNFSILINNLLAYGATRKNALFTILVTESLVLVTSFLLIIVITGGNNVSVYFSLGIFGYGAGIMMGLLVHFLGRKGYYVFCVLCAMIGGVVGFFSVSATSVIDISRFDLHLPIASLIFSAISVILAVVFTRKVTVRL